MLPLFKDHFYRVLQWNSPRYSDCSSVQLYVAVIATIGN